MNKSITVLIVLIISAIALVLPEYLPEAFIYLIGLAYLFIILAVSWDVMVGYTGQVNLGHTVFVGVGAYTAALLQTPARFQGTSLEFITVKPPIFVSIITGGVIAAFIGFLIGVITLRLRGYYFALVTAVLPLVFMESVYIWSDVFGGEEGFSIGLERALASTTLYKYYASFILMFISVAIMLYIVKSPLGLKFRALREDQELAEASGIDTVRYKLIAFVISSFFAGIGGAAIVHYRITAGPDLYGIPLMLLIILSTVIGGLGTIYGSVIGGFFIYLAKNWWLREIVDEISKLYQIPINDEIILYAILIAIAIFIPEGVYHGLKKRFKG
ncbi:MAG TPA: branched-chain amino acid ABC transporter permease [Archaeoglobaceae archaeon]|nr:branched-chain amino acid ABC transporter permease [Archaeoglobaceae archaeon]